MEAVGKLYSNDRARRAGYARTNYRMRRVRDRDDIEGLPDLKGEQGKYDWYSRKEFVLPNENLASAFSARLREQLPADGIPAHAEYLAGRFVRGLERSMITSACRKIDFVFKGAGMKESTVERNFTRQLKIYAVQEIKRNVEKWQRQFAEHLKEATPEQLQFILTNMETESLIDASAVLKELIEMAYGIYKGWSK